MTDDLLPVQAGPVPDHAGIEYEKVIAAHGSPIPFLRKGSREDLREATGATKLPALKLGDGTVVSPSRAIFSWTERQSSA